MIRRVGGRNINNFRLEGGWKEEWEMRRLFIVGSRRMNYVGSLLYECAPCSECTSVPRSEGRVERERG